MHGSRPPPSGLCRHEDLLDQCQTAGSTNTHMMSRSFANSLPRSVHAHHEAFFDGVIRTCMHTVRVYVLSTTLTLITSNLCRRLRACSASVLCVCILCVRTCVCILCVRTYVRMYVHTQSGNKFSKETAMNWFVIEEQRPLRSSLTQESFVWDFPSCLCFVNASVPCVYVCFSKCS